MAQLNITLNQEEILELLQNNSSDGFKKLLQESLNAILKAESTAQLGAAPYERTEDRRDSRNGFRERELITRVGSLELQVPRHRNVPFKTVLFENYSRSEAALLATMAEMVVNGVSTRKVSKIMETICGTSYSKSTVSEVCKELDEKVKDFRYRPLVEEYPFVIVDATYFKVRENHRIISMAFMVAYGVNASGIREVLGFDIYPAENRENWKNFLESLKKRGLHGIQMITSDAHDGIIYAISKVYPDVPWQRCQFHFSRNIADLAPKKYQAGIRAELNQMFHCDTVEKARIKRDEIIHEYQDVAEKAMQCLDEGFEDAMTAMILPKGLRRLYRTSNHIERLNKELKRRSKVIGVFPNRESLMRLMGSVLIELNERTQARRDFTPESLKAIQTVIPELRKAAIEQHKLLAA